MARLLHFIFSRPALMLYLILLQFGHIEDTWPNYDPQLQTRFLCQGSKLLTVEGENAYGKRFEATARRLDCAFSSRTALIYVYVHYTGDGAEDRSWNVAFRYRGTGPALSVSPTHRLRIEVAGPVEIEKQLTYVIGIPVDYAIGQPNGP